MNTSRSPFRLEKLCEINIEWKHIGNYRAEKIYTILKLFKTIVLLMNGVILNIEQCCVCNVTENLSESEKNISWK